MKIEKEFSIPLCKGLSVSRLSALQLYKICALSSKRMGVGDYRLNISEKKQPRKGKGKIFAYIFFFLQKPDIAANRRLDSPSISIALL